MLCVTGSDCNGENSRMKISCAAFALTTLLTVTLVSPEKIHLRGKRLLSDYGQSGGDYGSVSGNGGTSKSGTDSGRGGVSKSGTDSGKGSVKFTCLNIPERLLFLLGMVILPTIAFLSPSTDNLGLRYLCFPLTFFFLDSFFMFHTFIRVFYSDILFFGFLSSSIGVI